MRIVLLGPPGAGKGTQAREIAEHFSVPQISTGDMMRAVAMSGTELGLRLKQVMDTGALVSDELVLSIVKQRIQEDDCYSGCLFDGFPRTVAQAQGMEKTGIQVDWVIEIQADSPEIIRRLSGRRVHPGSGRVYHVLHNPPRREGLDDVTGEPLEQRDDDREETVARRLQVYRDETAPLVEFYAERFNAEGRKEAVRFVCVDGMQEVGKVTADILSMMAG